MRKSQGLVKRIKKTKKIQEIKHHTQRAYKSGELQSTLHMVKCTPKSCQRISCVAVGGGRENVRRRLKD
jgi:hypothetical protein